MRGNRGLTARAWFAWLAGMNKQIDNPPVSNAEIPDATLRRYARSYLYLCGVDALAALTYLEMLEDDFGPIVGDKVVSIALSL